MAQVPALASMNEEDARMWRSNKGQHHAKTTELAEEAGMQSSNPARGGSFNPKRRVFYLYIFTKVGADLYAPKKVWLHLCVLTFFSFLSLCPFGWNRG